MFSIVVVSFSVCRCSVSLKTLSHRSRIVVNKYLRYSLPIFGLCNRVSLCHNARVFIAADVCGNPEHAVDPAKQSGPVPVVREVATDQVQCPFQAWAPAPRAYTAA